MWALGCILYELMTLTMPWADVAYNAAGGMSALLRRIANSALDLTPCKKRYSLELCNLLASMLHKQPRNRPALKQVLQLDIISKAATRPVAAAPSSGPSSRKCRTVPMHVNGIPIATNVFAMARPAKAAKKEGGGEA